MSNRVFENQAAIVTGGASGIGRSTAIHLAGEGARVCVADVDLEGAEKVAKEISKAGGEAFALSTDVSREDGNETMVSETVERYGGLSLAFLNAGIARISTIVDGEIDAWDQVIAVNLKGVYLGLRAVAPAMIRSGGGTIVATASVAGLRGGGSMASYYAAKHGVVGLVKAAAYELAPQAIRVNAVCPGVIDTPILGPAHGVKEITEGILAKGHLLGRVGAPEEVAELVGFLLSERSSFMTGAAVPVDGGMTASIGGAPDPESGDAARLLFEKLGESSKG